MVPTVFTNGPGNRLHRVDQSGVGISTKQLHSLKQIESVKQKKAETERKAIANGPPADSAQSELA